MKTEAGSRSPYRFNWLKEHLRTPSEQRLYAQELAVLVATQTIIDAMEAAQLNRAELASRLGKSKGFVSQVLGGRNMTMRTLGDFLWACDRQVSEVLAAPIGQSTIPYSEMDRWLDGMDFVGEEDSLASNQKTLEMSLEPEQMSMGVAA